MKTYIFDTNVLLRYFLEDVESQYKEATNVVADIEKEEAQGRLSILVVAETVWTLQSVYKLERKTFIPRILNLVALKNIEIIEVKKSTLENVLGRMVDNKFDFVDVYLSVISKRKNLFSFDKDLEKLYKRFGEV